MTAASLPGPLAADVPALPPGRSAADIMYSTGETEVLNLDEIAQDGHMSLIESW